MRRSCFLAIFLTLVAVTFLCAADNPRLTIKIADVKATTDDSLITVPIYISHPLDTLAGIELYLKLEKNNHLTFALDDVNEEGDWLAVDTCGTTISGWEWLGINSLEEGFFDLKISAMADWPNQKMTPPAAPATDEILVKIRLRYDDYLPLMQDTAFSIATEISGTGFSDPRGNSIGVVTRFEKVCQEFLGDSCLVWKNVRRGYLDTTIVRMEAGSAAIKDTLGGHK